MAAECALGIGAKKNGDGPRHSMTVAWKMIGFMARSLPARRPRKQHQGCGIFLGSPLRLTTYFVVSPPAVISISIRNLVSTPVYLLSSRSWNFTVQVPPAAE